MKLNPKAIEHLKKELGEKLRQGVSDAAYFVQNETVPVKTGRLMMSTRAGDVEVEGDRVYCPLISGGLSLHGVFMEQTFPRDVDYALSVEIRTGYLRRYLIDIGDKISEGMQK